MLRADEMNGAGSPGLGPTAPPPAWPGFRPLWVSAVEPESSTVTSFRLADPHGEALPGAAPGQFVTVRLPVPDGPALLRSYSLSGPPEVADYRISVHRELGGLPHVHRHVRYTRPGPDDRHHDATGRLSFDVLATLDPPRDADAYLCGPTPFITDVTGALIDLGLDPARVHTELFGAAPGITPGIAAATAPRPHPPADAPGGGPPVAFARSNLTVGWDPAHASLLELAEACLVR
ncbi:MAG: hypothetical protein ACRDTX_27945 [Pseudonocardiaceae bacterium]